MRISYWSSDVCSSDLVFMRVPGFCISGRKFIHIDPRFQGGNADRYFLDRMNAFPFTVGTAHSCGAIALVFQPDRKSVVSGTSVSVRVDLGGRRIIKKQIREVRNTPRFEI